MLNYLQTPAQEARNLGDRLARASTRSRRGTSPDAGSRTKARSPDRREDAGGERGAERILSAGSRGSREVDVEPEARRAANFILEADDPDDDVQESVRRIKEAGRERDAGEDEGEKESE